MLLEIQADIFCKFHDGSFIKFIRNQRDVDFIIDIQYLAELINPQFSLFNCKFKNCTKLEYNVWEKEQDVIDDLNTLGKLDLEIISAEVINNYIAIKCYSSGGNCGGELVFIADDIIIFDEKSQVITLDEVNKICKHYWKNFNQY